MSPKNVNDRQRQQLIQTAARIMAEEGVQDFLLAKQKAAQRLRWLNLRALPSNSEVEQALRDYQRLFQAETQQRQLHALRATALEAMRFLARFEARIVGPVLEGHARAHDPIYLHVFATGSEEVTLFLREHRIPFTHAERSVRFGREQTERLPVLRFIAGEAHIELTIFPAEGLRRPPLSPVDGKPMLRATAATLAQMLVSS